MRRQAGRSGKCDVRAVSRAGDASGTRVAVLWLRQRRTLVSFGDHFWPRRPQDKSELRRYSAKKVQGVEVSGELRDSEKESVRST